MLLQITYQDKGTQTEPDTMENLLKAVSELTTQVGSMNTELQAMKKYISQQHDYKYAEIKGDDGKHLKTQTNIDCLNTVAGTSGTSSKKPHMNTNLNNLFTKPFIPKIPQQTPIIPQTTSYANSLYQDKKSYNHITRNYIDNIYQIQTYLNQNPRSTTTTNPQEDYITQKLQGYNRLIAQPKTRTNLVTTCFNYGLLNTVYTYDGEEIRGIPELFKAFTTFKRITKGELFFIKFYPATAEILFDEIKPVIQIVKIGLTQKMLIPGEIGLQPEIQRTDIPEFYANKRIIGLATIIQELANNYISGNPIWSYYSRDQLMIYANSKELRKSDMDEVQNWILSLLKPEIQPKTRALKKEFISTDLLTRYCKIIGHKYPDHLCSKCTGEDNFVPAVQME